MFGDSEVSTTFAAANTGVGSSSLSSRAELNSCKRQVYGYFPFQVGQNSDEINDSDAIRQR